MYSRNWQKELPPSYNCSCLVDFLLLDFISDFIILDEAFKSTSTLLFPTSPCQTDHAAYFGEAAAD